LLIIIYNRAYADYRDLIGMTEDMLEKMSVEIFGASHVIIPQLDFNQVTITKGKEKG
jgi:lysyl-tRNA synthetase class II